MLIYITNFFIHTIIKYLHLDSRYMCITIVEEIGEYFSPIQI